MSNKRVSELSDLVSSQVAAGDLFLVADISAIESKKITAEELQDYILSSGNITASLYGTASYVVNALSASYAPTQVSASYSLSGSYSRTAGSASVSVSSSYATSSFSATSASYALSCSFALTSSTQVVVSTTTADTASYLQYTVGRPNGTSTYALNALAATSSFTASFLNYTGQNTGTASHALVSAQTLTASFLIWDGVRPTGTASYAMLAKTASNAATVTSITNQYVYREFDQVTSSIQNLYTASFGWMQFTSSLGGTAKVIVEAYGDVSVPVSHSANYSCSLQLVMEQTGAVQTLDNCMFQYYVTASSPATNPTGSVICPFYLKGKFTIPADPIRMSGSVRAFRGMTFYTASRDVRCTIKATTDNFLDE